MKCSNPFCLFCVRPPGSSTTWTHQCWPACPAPSCCSAWPTIWCPPSPPECLAPISGESSVIFSSPLCRQVFLFCQSVLKPSYTTQPCLSGFQDRSNSVLTMSDAASYDFVSVSLILFFFPASQKWWSNREGDLRWCNENSCVSEHNTCHGLTGR